MVSGPVREPAVAGQFYPGTADELGRTVDQLLPGKIKKHPYRAIMVPHAGYSYSGEVAGRVYARTVIPQTCLMAGPNHTGRGVTFSVYSRGSWKTPLGLVPIEEGLSQQLMSAFPKFEEDTLAHKEEHCLEVQLPFLQRIYPDIKIVSIVVGSERLDTLVDAGRAIGRTLRESGKTVLLIASTDMTHYEPQKVAQKKDRLALQQILKLDPEALAHIVSSEGISMCGWAPTVMILAACQVLGVSKASMIDYRTSADKTGDHDSVVGYAGVVFE